MTSNECNGSAKQVNNNGHPRRFAPNQADERKFDLRFHATLKREPFNVTSMSAAPALDSTGRHLLRPFQGTCCRKCLPTSRVICFFALITCLLCFYVVICACVLIQCTWTFQTSFEGDPLTSLGLANILRVSTQNRWESSSYPLLFYVQMGTISLCASNPKCLSIDICVMK